MSSSVRSGDGSTLKISSQSRSSPSSTPRSRSYTRSMLASSLYAGMTTLRESVTRIDPGRRGHHQRPDAERKPDPQPRQHHVPRPRSARPPASRGCARCPRRPGARARRPAELAVDPTVALLDQPERRIQQRGDVAVVERPRARRRALVGQLVAARSDARDRESGRSSHTCVGPAGTTITARPAGPQDRGRTRASARRSSGTCSSRLALTTASTLSSAIGRSQASARSERGRRHEPMGLVQARSRSDRRRPGRAAASARAGPRAGSRSSSRCRRSSASAGRRPIPSRIAPRVQRSRKWVRRGLLVQLLELV